MGLDSNFSLAYDRKPMSFLHSGYSTSDSLMQSRFHDLMHELQELLLDWQTTSSTEPRRLLETETLNHYLNGVETIEQRATEAIGTPRQATQIPARIEQLFYELHMSYFKAQVHRLSSLSSSVPTSNRLRSFEQMKHNLRVVIQSFMTLKQICAVPNVAWDVQQATMSSALILAGIERAFETPDSRELLEKFARILPQYSFNVAEETEKMMEAGYCHGLEALKFILKVGNDGSARE